MTVDSGAAANRYRVPAVLVATAVSLALGLFVEPWFGLVAAGLSAALILRPFEPISALAALAAAASFVDNEGGRMARDLSVVTLVALYCMIPLALAWMKGRWRAPGGTMIATLLAFLTWTAVTTLRGVLAGHSIKIISLEVAALGSMAFTFFASGLRITARELRPALVVLVVAALGHVALGIVSYVVNHIRTGGVWYTPLPGMVAVLALCFAVRARSLLARMGWSLLLGLCLVHQTISFSRGYWLGLLVALPWTAFAFAGIRAGALARWRRVAAVAGLAALVLAAGTVVTAVALGWTDLPSLLGTRFGSSFATQENTSVTASNMERLLEYAASFRLIREQPLIGHGMGLELRIRDPFFHVVTRQAYVHQTYLWLWLKQGLVGLVLFLALLVQAIRTGLKGARSDDPEQAAWCLGAAGATVYMSVVNLTTFHLAQVNATMLQSLLWGFALATTRPAHWRLVWRARSARPAGERAGVHPA